MKNRKPGFYVALVIMGVLTLASCKKWNETGTGSVRIVTNKNGQTLGYDTTSHIRLILNKGFAFKDLNKNGKLDKYEDWRLPAEERAKDLASQMYG